MIERINQAETKALDLKVNIETILANFKNNNEIVRDIEFSDLAFNPLKDADGAPNAIEANLEKVLLLVGGPQSLDLPKESIAFRVAVITPQMLMLKDEPLYDLAEYLRRKVLPEWTQNGIYPTIVDFSDEAFRSDAIVPTGNHFERVCVVIGYNNEFATIADYIETVVNNYLDVNLEVIVQNIIVNEGLTCPEPTLLIPRTLKFDHIDVIEVDGKVAIYIQRDVLDNPNSRFCGCGEEAPPFVRLVEPQYCAICAWKWMDAGGLPDFPIDNMQLIGFYPVSYAAPVVTWSVPSIGKWVFRVIPFAGGSDSIGNPLHCLPGIHMDSAVVEITAP